MQNRFTKKAQKVLRDAGKVAQELGHNYVGTEHLLVALIRNPGVASEVLKANGVEEQKILDLIDESISAQSSVLVADEGEFTPRTQKVLEIAQEEASRMGIADAGTEHLLIALLKESDCIAVRLLNTKGINVQKLYVEALTASGQDMNTAKNEYMKQKNRKNKSTTPILDQYSRDLTALAREGKLDPVIGREREIERIVQILSRRTKNNPCLIGEPGVGKTAVVEGLARKIIEEDIPEILHNKRVLTLDLAGMVAGSKYRGEFEERIKRSLKEVMQSGNILLFIDEIHTIIGAGGAEGAIDAANILKPSLARGELQLIGATTREEYRKYIEKDAALERRFQSVVVEEPNKGEDRILVKSPKVATYDLKPEMSAYEVCDKLTDAIRSQKYDVIIINFANPDMVGHTGVESAAIQAVEAVDECVGKAVEALKEVDGQMFICADHGNAEQLVDYETGEPYTAHTTNPVPFILVNADPSYTLREGGCLADIAPTLIELMGMEQPKEMTGKSLLIKK